MDGENRSDQPKNFEQWLDSALRARLNVEPRIGLEERVLARLASKPRARSVWWPAMAMTGAVVAAIAIALALQRPTQPQRIVVNGLAHPATASAASGQAAEVPSRPTTSGIDRHRHSQFLANRGAACCSSSDLVSRRKAEEHLPKLVRFPAAHPETDEERMLAQLAAQLTAQRQFSEIAMVAIDSPPKVLSVKELSIEPLATTPENSSPQQ